jgi:hypothetical protein
MEPIKAKFAGTCSRTGQSYPAGALIVKLSHGKWALAQTRAGAVKVAPDYRLVRLNSGNERQVDINLPSYCKNCVEADGYTRDNLPENLRPNYARTREGERLVCQRCGSAWEIVSHAEIAERKREEAAEAERKYRADIEANLRLVHTGCGFYQLSHRIPEAMWKSVSQHFQFWSADDMDDMDYFDMPGGYYLLGDPHHFDPTDIETYLNGAPPSSHTRAALVEAILGIKPENTIAVRQERAKSEKEAYQIANTEKKRAIAEDFPLLFRYEDATEEGYPDPSAEQYQKSLDIDSILRGVTVISSLPTKLSF